MQRVQRSLALEILFNFALIVTVVTSAVFAGFAIRFLSREGGGLGSELVLVLLPKLLPMALSYSVPFAYLSAVTIGMGRWVADHEVTALKAAGVSPRALAVPVLAISAFIGVGGMWFNVEVVPEARRDLKRNLVDFLPVFLESLKGAERSVHFKRGRFSWERYDEQERRFVGAELDLRDGHGNLQRKIMCGARLGQLDPDVASEDRGVVFELDNAIAIPEFGARPEVDRLPANVNFSIIGVERVGGSVLFNDILGSERYLSTPKDMNLHRLTYVNNRGGVTRGTAAFARTQFHQRLVLGMSPFFFAFFALSLALVLPPSEHRVRNFLVTFIAATLLFFPLFLTGPSMSRNERMPSWLAMWAPHMLLGGVSLVLYIKAMRR